jgi:dephospho-CoA kinase
MTEARGDRPSGPGLLIGLTGPIGCGKSTVAGWLAELGATIIDADHLARSVTGRGEPTLGPIRARFGDAVFAPDGTLDRGALAGIVFHDPAELADLEAIVHPAVRRLVVVAVDAARTADAPIIAIEAIKLVEGGFATGCDEVWLVACDVTAQRARLAARGMAQEDATRRLAAQGTDLVARHAATLERLATNGAGRPVVRTVVTDGTPEEARERVEEALADALEPLFFPR